MNIERLSSTDVLLKVSTRNNKASGIGVEKRNRKSVFRI